MTDKPHWAPRSKRAIAELVEESAILTMEEVDQRYAAERVLVLVTHEDERHDVSHGRVLAHNRSRARISRMVMRVGELYPDVQLFPHLAGPQPSIEEYRRRILEHDFPEAVLRAW